MNQKCKYTVLLLGAGVQSSTIYLLMTDGEIEPATVAIFADTQEEEDEVYHHLDWLETVGGPPIVRVSAGRLGDDLVNGRGETRRKASIPAFTADAEGKMQGMVMRQCTTEYKIAPIEKWIRRELLGLKSGQRSPDQKQVMQYFGFSVDEPERAARTRLRFNQHRWGVVDFPLFWDDLFMTRHDCHRYLEDRVPHPVNGSVCTFCPYRSNRMWARLKNKPDKTDWNRAVEVDGRMREEGSLFNQGLQQKPYCHRSCRPLEEAYLEEDQPDLFNMDCEGGCGL